MAEGGGGGNEEKRKRGKRKRSVKRGWEENPVSSSHSQHRRKKGSSHKHEAPKRVLVKGKKMGKCRTKEKKEGKGCRTRKENIT